MFLGTEVKYDFTSTETRFDVYRVSLSLYLQRAIMPGHGFHIFPLDLKIVVYGKRLTSNTLFAIKTKSLTVKCITYGIYSKCRKLRIDAPCLTTETWRLMSNDFLLT